MRVPHPCRVLCGRMGILTSFPISAAPPAAKPPKPLSTSQTATATSGSPDKASTTSTPPPPAPASHTTRSSDAHKPPAHQYPPPYTTSDYDHAPESCTRHPPQSYAPTSPAP